MGRKWTTIAKCQNKEQFKNELEASLEAQRLFYINRVPLYPYRCPVCEKYHLTKQKPKGKNNGHND